MARASRKSSASKSRAARGSSARKTARSNRRSPVAKGRTSRASASTRRGAATSKRRTSAARRAPRTVANTTTNHEEIRRWAEDRGAHPACVKGTGSQGDVGMLRLDFPGYTGQRSLQAISWDEWFEKFDERGLALLYQDKTARGQRSNFNKLVSRSTASARARRPSVSARGSSRQQRRRAA